MNFTELLWIKNLKINRNIVLLITNQAEKKKIALFLNLLIIFGVSIFLFSITINFYNFSFYFRVTTNWLLCKIL